jgi:5-methylcytosine-specific restriction protein A
VSAERKIRGTWGPPRVGPNGRRLCRWCGLPVPSSRRTFCGTHCVHEWLIRSDPRYVRTLVYRRDRGVCARCGRDCSATGDWEAHHRVPVADGGGLCGLDGYQTLCRACHWAETAAWRRERAEQRRLEMERSMGVLRLPLEGEGA